jgi:MOSC domain
VRAKPQQPESAQPVAQSVGTLVSVNIGMPKNVPWPGKNVYTGVFTDPVSGHRRVGRLNVEGDGRGESGGHGGEQRAVFVYQIASYRYWERELGRDDFVYGQSGENFTVEGPGDDKVCIGEHYQIGTAMFEVTHARSVTGINGFWRAATVGCVGSRSRERLGAKPRARPSLRAPHHAFGGVQRRLTSRSLAPYAARAFPPSDVGVPRQ